MKDPARGSLEFQAAKRQEKAELKSIGAILVIMLVVSGLVVAMSKIGKRGNNIELVYPDWGEQVW